MLGYINLFYKEKKRTCFTISAMCLFCVYAVFTVGNKTR